MEINLNDQIFEKMNKGVTGFVQKLYGAEDETKSLEKSVEKVFNVFNILETSDEIMRAEAKLNMLNDSLFTTEELMWKVYSSAKDARGSHAAMEGFVTQIGINSGTSFACIEEIIAFGNLMQKQMTIAGLSTAEASEMMRRLAQETENGSIGSNILNDIFMRMPNIVEVLARKLSESKEMIHLLAVEGKISLSDLKYALISSTDEINEKFYAMPMTWEQMWSSMKIDVLKKFWPIIQTLNNVVNNETFQQLVNVAINTLGSVANILGFLANGILVMSENWEMIVPILGAVIAIMGMYKAALIANNIIEFISGIMAYLRAKAMLKNLDFTLLATSKEYAYGAAVAATTVAQASFNTTLLASPITWVTLAVLAFVVGLVMLCNWIAKATGATQSGFGIIAGVVGVVGAAIWNTIIGLLNGILQFAWTCFFEPVIGIMEFVLNAFSGGFDSFGGMVGNLMANVISWFLSFGKVATKVIDAVFGTDWTSELESLQDALLETGKTGNAITLDNSMPTIGERISYGDAWEDASAWGDEKAGQLGNLFSSFEDEFLDPTQFMAEDYMADAGELEDNTAQIADNTASIKDSVDISNENLKYLRDIAERDAVNRFTTAQIKVAMTNNNNINNSMDLDGIINHLVNGVNEAMVQSAEGVNAYA